MSIKIIESHYHKVKNKMTKCACNDKQVCLKHANNTVAKWSDKMFHKELTYRYVKKRGQFQLTMDSLSKTSGRKGQDSMDIPEGLIIELYNMIGGAK